MEGKHMSRKTKAAEFADVSYNVDVQGKNILATDSMKDYAMEKVSKIEKFMNRIIDVSVILEVQKLEHRCNIILKVGHTKVKSQAISDNMYASIDKAVDRLETQLLKYKSRLQDYHSKDKEAIEMNVNVLRANEADLQEINSDIDDENQKRSLARYTPHEIVRQKKLALKFLTNDEAVMKMELTGDAFLVFKGEADRKLKVIYRRRDDSLAIIEPEL